ncbi:MAG: hypothetical protein Q9220_004035 [cf. Caloplaca sp. 1 TL-2023]
MKSNISQTFPTVLASRIHSAIRKYPDLQPLFHEIAAHISNSTTPQTNEQPEPTPKKRKFEPQDFTQDTGAVDSITDVSFSIPQRKKLKLELGRNAVTGSIKGTNPTTNESEFGIHYSAIEYCICLPVPEKAQPQYSFCVFPQQNAGDGEEQLLFTVLGTKVKPETIQSELSPANAEETYKDATIRMLNKRLKRKVIEPDPHDFTSQVSQAYRKGEKALHIKAFRGSKDGFLFLLPHGLIFAFKKPLLLLPFASILSISYTSILQRTFNLVVTTQATASGAEDASQEIEFSMLDQVDFAGIDAYIKRHGLHDASMAEQRRARKLNINGSNKKGEDEVDGEGELEKAAREAETMDDDEDEEEDENFDPGSEGESEGSGSSSEGEDVEGAT